MDFAIADETQGVESGSGDRHWLITGATEDGLGFRFMQTASPGDSPIHVPRHHHPFAQVRWAQKGKRSYGIDQFIPEGDLAYFPRAAYYGPELLNDTPDEVCTTLQFGFGAEYKPIKGEIPPLLKDGTRGWPERLKEEKPLAQTERHLFSPEDAFPGVPIDNWRETKRPIAGQVKDARQIPPEGYDAVILMHPQAQPYFEVGPGAELKHLGRFYDHPGPNGDTGVSMVRMQEGGEYKLSAERAHLVWSVSPGLKLDGRICPPVTSLYSPRDEETVLTGVDGVELVIVEFPRLD
jgi:hypothetical protein